MFEINFLAKFKVPQEGAASDSPSPYSFQHVLFARDLPGKQLPRGDCQDVFGSHNLRGTQGRVSRHWQDRRGNEQRALCSDMKKKKKLVTIFKCCFRSTDL